MASTIDRRTFLRRAAGALVAASLVPRGHAAPAGRTMLTRPIPRTGEPLPCVGLGTWQTFDVALDASTRSRLGRVLRTLHERGGRVVDSSPMYGRAESVVGDLAQGEGLLDQLFVATKVWTRGRREGEQQIRQSMERLRRARLDLLQVHNLVDVDVQLETLRRMKGEGVVRYIGVTHYQAQSFPDLVRLLRTEALDFVQLPYSLGLRDAERELLPAAADTGTAVLVNRPFEEGALFRAVRGRDVPEWAAAFGATSWGTFFLEYILAHPAVTCVIPATGDLRHLDDDLAAGEGRLPDAGERERMIRVLTG